MFNFFPYTNFHELNADWILKKVKEVGEGFVNFTKEITEKVNNLSTKIDNEIKEIPNIVKKDTDAKLNEWKNDGTFENLIEKTYGSLNFLDNISGSNIVVLGDSLSDTARDSSWILEFRKIVANANITVTSFAKSGDALAQQKTKFDACTVIPDILLIWCGINDVKAQTSLSSIISSLDGIRTKVNALNPKCQIYLMSTYKNKRLGSNTWKIPETAYWRLYSAYATKNGWTFIDAFSSAPIISTETEAIRKEFYVETSTTGNNYLHYTSNYSKILAQWILQIFISKSPVPLGDYKEKIEGSLIESMFNATAAFAVQPEGTYILFGTRSVLIRLAGKFTAPNGSKLYTKIGTLPNFVKPVKDSGTLFTMAYRGGGFSSEGGDFVTKCAISEAGNVYLYNIPEGRTEKNSDVAYFIEYVLNDIALDYIYSSKF
jgi:hypothetical protein